MFMSDWHCHQSQWRPRLCPWCQLTDRLTHGHVRLALTLEWRSSACPWCQLTDRLTHVHVRLALPPVKAQTVSMVPVNWPFNSCSCQTGIAIRVKVQSVSMVPVNWPFNSCSCQTGIATRVKAQSVSMVPVDWPFNSCSCQTGIATVQFAINWPFTIHVRLALPPEWRHRLCPWCQLTNRLTRVHVRLALSQCQSAINWPFNVHVRLALSPEWRSRACPWCQCAAGPEPRWCSCRPVLGKDVAM